MHIAIVNLTRGGFSGGYRKYLQMLVPLLEKDPRVSRVDVHTARSWPSPELGRLRAQLRQSRPDVVFVPTAQTIDCGRPVVTMIRNMEPLSVPFDGNPWSERVRNVLRARAARRAVRRAARVIAVSRHVRDFLVDRWGVDAAKVGVVYHGADESAPPRMPAALAQDLPSPFLFTAGSIRPARGLDDLIGALENAGHTLLIAGEPDPAMHRYAAELRERARSLPVRWLGRLDAAEMAWCFQNCRAFVMTSRAEACPNIVLEAMAGGALSISTDCAPMPELFGHAAIYYRARDARDLAARLAALRTMSETEIDALRARARSRARDFTWQATAAQTIAQLELALR